MARGQVWKRKSGAYALRYRDHTGKRRYEHLGHVTKQEAEERLTAVLRDVDLGQWRPPSRDTLQAFGEQWLERRKLRLAKSTACVYATFLRTQVYPRLGDRELRSLGHGDFDDLVCELEYAGMPARSIRNTIAPVRAMLSDAVRRGLILTNPAKGVDLPPLDEGAGVDIPDDHLVRIRWALGELAPDDPYRAGEKDVVGPLAYDVAVGAGVRWSELAALRWEHVDFKARLIRVDEAIVLGEVKRPKSGERRVVPMFDTVHTALRALAARALDRGRYSPAEHVLTSGAKERLVDHSNWGRTVWKPALQKAGLGEWAEEDGEKVWKNAYRWHDLRGTCLSRLVEAGADVALVQSVAGHSDPSTTLKLYVRVREERAREAARRFDPGSVRAPSGHHAGAVE